MWAILTDREKRNGGWDVDEFFTTGRAEIAQLMARSSALGRPARRGTALDFGCGAGRLTQALADYFDTVTGVDIAPAMLELARRYNRHGERCRYVLNTESHLEFFPASSFDLVYSRITLQHLPPRIIRKYLAEFIRVLRTDGLLVFQLPDRYRNWRDWLRHSLYRIATRRIARRSDVMEMHGIQREKMVAWLESRGARVIDIEEDPSAGPEWLSWRYFVVLNERR